MTDIEMLSSQKTTLLNELISLTVEHCRKKPRRPHCKAPGKMLQNGGIQPNIAKEMKFKECGVVSSRKSACDMLKKELRKSWKGDMQVLKTQEEEDTDREMEDIPSVRKRKIEILSTTWKGMQKSGYGEE